MTPIIIPVFNRLEYSSICLDSLYETPHGALVVPIVVDNGSRPRTSNWLAEWQARWDGPDACRPIIARLPRNAGYAAALNQGIRAAKEAGLWGDHVFLMHNDCVPAPGWAKEMLDCIGSSDEETLVAIPRTNYANEHTPCIPDLRAAWEAIKPPNKERIEVDAIRGLLAKLYPLGLGKVSEDLATQDPRTSYSPEMCSFCCVIKPKAFEENPGFDEDFFPRGQEDKFWWLKMERQGFACMRCNRAFVHHSGNITSDGPGFAQPEIAAVAQEKYREKVKEMDQKRPSVV